jgi:hypothetical protein
MLTKKKSYIVEIQLTPLDVKTMSFSGLKPTSGIQDSHPRKEAQTKFGLLE